MDKKKIITTKCGLDVAEQPVPHPVHTNWPSGLQNKHFAYGVSKLTKFLILKKKKKLTSLEAMNQLTMF